MCRRKFNIAGNSFPLFPCVLFEFCLFLTLRFVEIAAKNLLKTKEKLNRILAENCGKDYETLVKDTDRDNWMSANEAMEYGLVDKVIEKR